MRIVELFAGIGSCSVALKRIGFDIEIIDAVDNDKYAIASFNAIHNTDFPTKDIKEYNEDLKKHRFNNSWKSMSRFLYCRKTSRRKFRKWNKK